jgi:hypothetical protein
MLAKAHNETFASNLSAAGLRMDWDWMIAESHVDEFGEQLPVSEEEDELRGDIVVHYFCDTLQWDAPKWTNSVQVMPELHTYFRELSEAAFYITCRDLTSMWFPEGTQYRRARTDDGFTSLRNDVFSVLVDCAKHYIPSRFPSLPEEVVDAPRKEPHQEAIEWIKRTTDLSWDRVSKLLGVTRQAVNAWRRGGPIRDDHRQRLFEVHEVLKRAAKRHPRPSDLVAWLDTPRGTDARTPAKLLEAGEIGKARLLAITSSSPKVKAPSERAKRYALEAYEVSRERVRALPPELDEELLAEMTDEE